ncbi:HIG1 domain family member 2A, mitochondrial [Pseudomyrmex gracilis]|uniref:HIG1 domain family member 2A, mitochondrial n=1 Tax=Pseudomyrmex gracilis TaxID=219809 RepID=UPI000994DCE3|nr:HIG1 domain family member 2A, mitochondrial [Pseudomyrmex gracilis]
MANVKDVDLDWVKIREDLDSTYLTETILEKAKRKTRENPLVPIGSLATATALTVGLINFYRGKSQMQQYMMRARVAAQAFTIACIAVGVIFIPGSK